MRRISLKIPALTFAFISMTAPLALGASSDLMAVSQATQYSPSTKKNSLSENYKVTLSTVFLGPSVNNFDGHLYSTPTSQPAPRSRRQKTPEGAKPSTYTPSSSFRHTIAAGVRLSENMLLGPVVELSHKINGPYAGEFKCGDPLLKLLVSNFFERNFAAESFHSSLWVSASAPVTNSSREVHHLTTLSASIIPRLIFHKSDFIFSGIFTGRAIVNNRESGSGLLSPLRLFAGIQANYRLRQNITPYLMIFSNGSMGPEIPLSDFDLAADEARSGKKFSGFSLMPGALIRITDVFSIAPRMSWNTRRPIETTTIGLNASFQLI